MRKFRCHMMKNLFHISWSFALLAVLSCSVGQAQETFDDPEARRFIIYEMNGETYMDGTLQAVDITAKRPSRYQIRKGRKRLAKFTRLRWNVHKVYPYAVKVGQILQQVNIELQEIEDPKERKKYLKSKEVSLFGEYEDDLRRMSRSQGKVLVKLVHRQTGNSTFHLIKEVKSGVSAVFWQSIGLLFGINLKSEYDPEEEAMIEEIVKELETGGYNICYKRYAFLLR